WSWRGPVSRCPTRARPVARLRTRADLQTRLRIRLAVIDIPCRAEDCRCMQTGSAHPYSNLPSSAFWSRGVVQQHPLAPVGVYSPKFPISKTDKVMTAGSCFAQHVGRQLKSRGYNVLDYEPAPPGMGAGAQDFGFKMYSGRY